MAKRTTTDLKGTIRAYTAVNAELRNAEDAHVEAVRAWALEPTQQAANETGRAYMEVLRLRPLVKQAFTRMMDATLD